MYKVETEISPDNMRYDTSGDYYYTSDGTLNYEIVKHGNDFFGILTLIHELIESQLLIKKGVDLKELDQFDFDFNADIERVVKYLEPGADPSCPYKKEHDFADLIVKMICAKAGIHFDDYMNDVISN
jgi:hypothetical protein